MAQNFESLQQDIWQKKSIASLRLCAMIKILIGIPAENVESLRPEIVGRKNQLRF
jgi:hypothetical protein